MASESPSRTARGIWSRSGEHPIRPEIIGAGSFAEISLLWTDEPENQGLALKSGQMDISKSCFLQVLSFFFFIFLFFFSLFNFTLQKDNSFFYIHSQDYFGSLDPMSYSAGI